MIKYSKALKLKCSNAHNDIKMRMLVVTWCKTLSLSASFMKGWRSSSFRAFHLQPSSFEISALCLSGWTSTILRRSSCDHTMKAFIGRLMWLGVCFFVWKANRNFFYLSQKNLQLMSRIFFDENLLFMALTSWKESAFLQVKTKRSEYNGRPALNIIGSWSAIFCNKKGVAWNKIYEWEYW